MNESNPVYYELNFTLLNLDHISSHCPLCHFTTTKIHSKYIRTIGDLPVSGKIVQLKLHVRKFFCENTNCIRKIFTERFKHQLNSYGRRFERLNEQLSSMGLELGGNVAHRISKLSFIKISASIILRLIVKCPIPAIKSPKIIGVDYWAFKKRLKYGTIIVDLETNEVIDLLTAGGVPQREAVTLTNWLKKYSSVAIVSRDRSSTYTGGITQARDKIIQIADRWHILKNLTEGFERFLNTQRGSLSGSSI